MRMKASDTWHERIKQLAALSQYERKAKPPNLRTKEEWSIMGRAIPARTMPTAILFHRGPINFADDLRIVEQCLKLTPFLYTFEQTKPFKSKITKACHQFFGLFCQHAHRRDYIYKQNADPASKGWPHSHRRLNYSVVRKHIRQREIIGGIGDHYTRHLVFDIDYHAQDSRREFFLARAKVFYEEMPRWFNAWFAECKQENIGGIHFYGLTAKQHISKAQFGARKFLEYLDRQYPTLAAIESFTRIEVYPVERKGGGGTGCRLALCKGRVTITDEFLAADPKANCVNLVEWLLSPNETRKHVPLNEFMTFMVKNTPEHPRTIGREVKKDKAGRNAGANEGMGSIGRLKGCFYRKMIDFWTGNLVPEADTICKFVGPTLRALKFEGLAEEQAVDLVEDWLLDLEETSFSDRLTDDFKELMRVVRADAKQIWINNGYQPRIDESNQKLGAAVKFYNRRGVFISKRQSWENIYHMAPASVDFEEFADFEFAYDERLLLKQYLHSILRSRGFETTIQDTYEVARRVVLFAKKYPYRELAAAFVPALCAGLNVKWHRKKANAVLSVLVGLQFIRKTHKKVWRGHLKQFNRACRYMAGEAVLHHFTKKTREPATAGCSPTNYSYYPLLDGGCGIVSIITPLGFAAQNRILAENEAEPGNCSEFEELLTVDSS
jgi:hypothetical protein